MQDGRASLPFFIRWWIERFYPPFVIDEVDKAGRRHDRALECMPGRWRMLNALMVERLQERGVPGEVYVVIECGLWLYWMSPVWVRRVMWWLVPRG